MTLVRGIMSCGCVFRRDAEGLAAGVGDAIWCPNHQAAVELEALDPIGPEANGGAAA